MTDPATQPPQPIARRIAGLFYSHLAKASLGLFIGSLAAGVLGYVFQVLMGRMLSPQEYGLFGAIMALFVFLSSPLATVVMVVARKVSAYRAREDDGSVRHFYLSILLWTNVAGVAFLAVYALLGGRVQGYLKSPAILPVYLLGALTFVNALPLINNAFLQGLQKFSWLSITGALAVLLKILFAAGLIRAGFGVGGALGGTILSALAAFGVTYWAIHGPLAAGRGRPFQTDHLDWKAAVPVFVWNVVFSAMTQLDVVLVNYFFPAHDAGLYVAASVLGKAVMYLPGGITLALFPMVAENHAGGKGSAHLLAQALGLVALLCTAGALFYFCFGGWLMGLLYGPAYAGAGEILRWYGFAILPMALVMVVENFLIAKGRVMFAYLFPIFVPFQLAAVYFFHDTLLTVLGVIAVFGVLLVGIGFGLLWRAVRASPKPA